MTRTIWMRRVALCIAAAPLLLLAGCPSDTTGASGKTQAQRTAPSIAGTAGGPKTTAVAVPLTDPGKPVPTPAQTAQAQALVARAQANYQSGVNNYQANHLDAARMDFDAAVDLMLTSGMDLEDAIRCWRMSSSICWTPSIRLK